MFNYIKQINYPWIKIRDGINARTGDPTYKYINIEKIESVDFDSVWYVTGTRDTLGCEVTEEIGDFLMTHRFPKIPINPIINLTKSIYETQSMADWLEENGQL